MAHKIKFSARGENYFMKKLSAVIIILLLLIIFSPKVYASQSNNIFYYELENGQTKLKHEAINFIGDFTKEQIAFIIFDNLIDSKRMFIPKNSHLIWAKIKDENLILNISNQIKNYGGSYFEKHLVNQIKMTANNLKIQSLKILIDGENEYLSEGTIF